ncbi:MAG: FAD-dependent oxidoreductase [Rhodopirellula sp.]|nr:FAD-dependent oxidoreductase [Rhodopirellula sp.]OUX51003.1 MAG: FAD-dependent oxidoreductase [Rhodopirellula sp. TMED283]
MVNTTSASVPHVVIIGGGFGGLETARNLRKSDVQVTLVDRHNYHLFQPLLYQVATGGLSPANIATPLRSIFRRQANCEVLMAEVRDFDLEHKRLILADGELEYDHLVVAAGATHSYFGHEEWASVAPGLKTLQDATSIRRKVFLAFEAAERERDLKIREQMMTFVVVGGGPTGIELAGALSEIARHTIRNDFRHIHPEDARIVVVEAAEHVLAHYPSELCKRAAGKIRELGIEIHTQTRVTQVTEEEVHLSSAGGEKVIRTQTVLWAAGVHGSPLGRKLAKACGIETDRVGRVGVTNMMNVEGQDEIFVIGDLADCTDGKGVQMPGLAPVAIQQAQYVAKRVLANISGTKTEQPFVYHDRGTMATIGRAKAVVKVGKRESVGFIAWVMWLVVHLLQIVQFQSRFLILFQWSWNYLTFSRSARIITGDEPVILIRDEPGNDASAIKGSVPEDENSDSPSDHEPSE